MLSCQSCISSLPCPYYKAPVSLGTTPKSEQTLLQCWLIYLKHNEKLGGPFQLLVRIINEHLPYSDGVAVLIETNEQSKTWVCLHMQWWLHQIRNVQQVLSLKSFSVLLSYTLLILLVLGEFQLLQLILFQLFEEPWFGLADPPYIRIFPPWLVNTIGQDLTSDNTVMQSIIFTLIVLLNSKFGRRTYKS